MKIAIVIEKFIPAAGGNERSAEQIARRLIRRGHDVTILAHAADAAAALPEGGRIVTAGGPPTRSARGLRRFVGWAERRIEREGFDVSLSMSTAVAADVIQPRGGTVAETQARNVAMRRDAVARWVKRTTLAITPKQRALLTLERRAMGHGRVKRIVAISGYVADQLDHHYGLSGERVCVIPNAAEVGSYSEAERQEIRREQRQRLGISEGRTAFLYAARNHKLKGLLAACEALHELINAGDRDGLVLTIAGPVDGLTRQAIKRVAGLENTVQLGDVRSLDRYLLAADALVHPTWYDPSSKVVLEALLLGRPAISTLHNGASQWIYDPTGEHPIPSAFDEAPRGLIESPVRAAGRVIASPADTAALARAMADLCDPETRAACAAAMEGLDRCISMDRHVERLEGVLREVAEEGG